MTGSPPQSTVPTDPAVELARLGGEVAAQGAEIARLRAELARKEETLGASILWERVLAVIDSMAEALMIFAAGGELVLSNAAARELFSPRAVDGGATLSDFTRVYELVELDGSVLPAATWPAARALAGERVVGCEMLVRRKSDGMTRAVLLNAVPARDAASTITHAVLTIHEITQRITAEQSLRRQFTLDRMLNRLLASLASAGPADIADHIRRSLSEVAPFIGADEAHVIHYSPARDTLSSMVSWTAAGLATVPGEIDGTIAHPRFGWLVERLRAGQPVRINHPDDFPPGAEEHRRHFHEQGSAAAVLVPMRGGGGRVRGALWLRSRSRPVRWADEDVALLGMMSDAIASAVDRNNAEQALRESERRVRSIATATPTFLMEIDAAGRVRYINRVHEAFDESQILGTTLRDWVPEEMRATVDELVGLAYSSGQTQSREYAYTAPSGRVHTYLAQLGPYSEVDGGRQGALLTVTDISEWRRTSLELGESQRRLRRAEQERDLLFDLSVDLFCVAGLDGTLKQWNPAVERTLGWSGHELGTRSFVEFFHPEDLGRFVEKFGQNPIPRATLDDEYRFLCKDGSFRWISWSSFASPDENLIFSVGRDTTERRREEEARRQLETQLRQSQKMEGIGRLAGGIAHDFNNILAVILSYASFARGALTEVDAAYRDVLEIETAASRASDLTRQLLAFSRKSIVNPRIVDLNVTLAGLEMMIRRIVGEDIALSFEKAAGLWSVKLDPSSVDQIVLNLVVNARDAMPVGGRLRIETANATADDVRRHPEMPAGDFVKVSVSDTGTGMSAAVQEHLFEPFFTTKKEGKGTGLGLATVYGIVKQSRGFVFADSELGRGSRFEMYFPRAPDAIEGVVRRAPVVPVGSSATVLVVDDEPAIRRIAVRCLHAAGYTVLEADGASGALALAARFQGRIDLVLTDVIMPDMNGRQMVEQLRQARSALTVLYMSGYTDDTIARHGVTESEVHYIQKPFTPPSLLAAVEGAIRDDRQG